MAGMNTDASEPFEPFEPLSLGIDWGMPVEVMRDFDTVLLFGKFSAASTEDLTVRCISRELHFPIIKERSPVLVRCYDNRMDPVLLRARVVYSSGFECTMDDLEKIAYKTRRKHVRCPLCPPASTFALEDMGLKQPQPCLLVNTSAGGACIVTRSRYTEGQTLCLRMCLSEAEECTPYLCKVLRVTPRRGGCFEYGLLFVHLSQNQRDYLADAMSDRFRTCFGSRSAPSDGDGALEEAAPMPAADGGNGTRGRAICRRESGDGKETS